MANKVNTARTLLFLMRDIKSLPLRTSAPLFQLIEDGWKFAVTDQRCGWCRFSSKEITIPTWICSEENRSNGRFIQYVAHEIAHALDFSVGNHRTKGWQAHGSTFQEFMKQCCPPEHWHWELDYKPRLAKAAGISKHLLSEKDI